MKENLLKRLSVFLLVAALLMGLAALATAAGAEHTEIQLNSDELAQQIEGTHLESTAMDPMANVRVSIVLEEESTLMSGFATTDIAENQAAMAYNDHLQAQQEALAERISNQVLGGQELDVEWHLTLAGNIISANVPFCKISEIEAMDGVAKVVMERQYEPQVVSKEETAQPQMYTSGGMIGTGTTWAKGYTGAGSRIAIIDTGTDTNHQSFNADAFIYSLQQNAAAAGMTYANYVASLDLLDQTKINSVRTKLNSYERTPSTATAANLYGDEKLAYGYNYIDKNFDLTHDNDQQSEHGSHVAGIATANRYIYQSGSYVDALENVSVAGVAPDAQLITMKVFGSGGGAYDSDYMAAIEDAILLNCDVVNLSLGSTVAGFTFDTEGTYAELLAYLETTDTVVVISAGNNGNWASHVNTGMLYNDHVGYATGGSPGTYTNSLCVASVDNAGAVNYYFSVKGMNVVYTESSYSNAAMRTLDKSSSGTGTAYSYVFIDGYGTASDFTGINVSGKVVFCSRGEISFYEKAENAVAAGAVATVIYNNTTGTLNMDLTDYSKTAPCVSILQSEGAAIKALSQANTASNGTTYYTGTMTIVNAKTAVTPESGYYTMSTFSSWGVPGDLSMKPEISAPGGSILSVNGQDTSGTAYELMSGTSMAAPQVTGMTAVVMQYIREKGLDQKITVTNRALAQSLLMSTAQPLKEEASGTYYSILNQGAGLGRVDLATSAKTYILVDGQTDGKVKVELYDDPDRVGQYSFRFSINNLEDKAAQFTLSADLFTQAVKVTSGVAYHDTTVTDLPVTATFKVDGKEVVSGGSVDFDMNGDGTTDVQDATYLLGYLVGENTTLYCGGDVDGDGKVHTDDAYALLKALNTTGGVTVPANGSVTVDVTLTLPQDTKTYLDENHPKGAFIEAFVYANAVADAEGNMGVSHSIPVLGFYGNWTEPSMFDVGSYPEYNAGADTRTPYLSNAGKTNFFTRKSGSSEYYFGGNSYATDSAYLPERTAFNNASSQTIANVYYSLIRNAIAGRLLITNAQTGAVYKDVSVDGNYGAYYSPSEGTMKNTQFTAAIGWAGTDASGKALAEGTKVNVTLMMAPEYYMTDSGDIDWNALGAGACFTTPITIDNTKPVKHSITQSGSTVTVVAQDENYVAAVLLYNSSGTLLERKSANQTTPNAKVSVAFDMSSRTAGTYKFTIIDYAGNSVSYSITTTKSLEAPAEPAAVSTSAQVEPLAADDVHTVTIDLTEQVDVNNGMVELSYDASKLTFQGISSNLISAHKAANGKVTFAYATVEGVEAGQNLATATFTYTGDYINTNVTYSVSEYNETVLTTAEQREVFPIVEEHGGHDYQVSASQDATCTEDGYTTYTCTKCGDSYTETITASGHAMGDWTTVTAPTCTEKGEERRDCANCDHYETREVEENGHKYQSVVTAPTCTEQGYTTHTCSVCGDSYVDSYVEASGHAMGDWTTVTAPTCTEKGEERRDCANCDHYETREVEENGHKYQSVVTAPTCTEQGYTTHTCSVCGDSYVDSYVAAHGHKYESEIVGNKEVFTCIYCEDTYEVELPTEPEPTEPEPTEPEPTEPEPTEPEPTEPGKTGIFLEDGLYYYYVNGEIQYAAGLVEVDGDYYYIRSNGTAAIGSYWCTNTNGITEEGFYLFAEDGKMIMTDTSKTGIYYEDGMYYYYVAGEIQFGAGLVQVDGYYYYIRSGGYAATGRYYVTTTNGLMEEGEYTFGEDGKMIPKEDLKNGVILEDDGLYYYYVDGEIQYAAGLVQVGGDYYYIRSNGTAAIGSYWVTNTNGLTEEGFYIFAEDGKMILTDTTKTGLYLEDGLYYYYVAGEIQFGAGLVLIDGDYYYIRSGGYAAIGSYWVTNTNDLMPEGMYTFGEDGKMIR